MINRWMAMLTVIGLILGALVVAANDRTDKGYVSVSTLSQHFNGKEEGSGYWGSVFIPMQSLWDIDNRLLEKIKAPFTIEQIRRDRNGNRTISPFQNMELPESFPRSLLRRDGVTFAQYNSQYQATQSTHAPEASEGDDSGIPLSDLLVPATQSE